MVSFWSSQGWGAQVEGCGDSDLTKWVRYQATIYGSSAAITLVHNQAEKDWKVCLKGSGQMG